MEELEKVFKRFDANGDGKISSTELRNILNTLAPNISPEEIQQMMSENDTDGDGYIDFQEFADFHREGNNGDASTAGGMRELKDAFYLYDRDKNGLISVAELHMVLESLGEKCSLHDCSKIMKYVDIDGDGNVNFEEFKMMMTKGILKGRLYPKPSATNDLSITIIRQLKDSLSSIFVHFLPLAGNLVIHKQDDSN